MTKEEIIAYNKIEKYYYELKYQCSTTSTRKYRYNQIKSILNDYPNLRYYCSLRPNRQYYVERVVLLQGFSKVCYSKEEDKGRTTPCAYIVMLPNGVLKVGKTNNTQRRFYQLQNEYSMVEVLHTFPFDNEEDAYIMEVILHKYYKEKEEVTFIPNDRFENATFTEKDKIILEKVAEKIRKEKWY